MAIEQIKSDDYEFQRIWGGFNDFPPGWKQVEEAEFAQSQVHSHIPQAYEYRQMWYRRDPETGERLPETQPAVFAILYFLHDNTGYAIQYDWHDKKVRFFLFGCEHKWGDASEEIRRRGVRLGRCESANYCEKCHYFETVDSSD